MDHSVQVLFIAVSIEAVVATILAISFYLSREALLAVIMEKDAEVAEKEEMINEP